MTPGENFKPVGQTVMGSASLGFHFDDQQFLEYEMKRIVGALEGPTNAKPEKKWTKLTRIPLLDDTGVRSADRLWVNVSEHENGLVNAVIDTKLNGSLSRYALLPSFDRWDLITSSVNHGDNFSSISTETLVESLIPRLKKPDFLNPFLDQADPSGAEVAQMLAKNLKNTAPISRSKVAFKASTPVANDAYRSEIVAHLGHHEFNHSHEYGLTIHAPYIIGHTAVDKAYKYLIEATRNGTVKKVVGKVEISSDHGFSPEKLDFYAARDQVRNDPLFSLHSALEMFRNKYQITDEEADVA